MSQSKNRPCPVVGKTITSRDCAEKRCPEFGCPGDCPFNPWGHEAYPEPFLDMEAALKDWAFSKLPESLVRSLPGLYADPGSEESAVFFYALTHAVHVGDGSRPSPLGQWLRDYSRELRKDERMLAGWRDQAMPMLLEVHQVVDEAGMECVDLLEPDRPPFILRDMGMTPRVGRFQLLFGWAYHTPWFSRALGLLSPMAWRTAYSPEECLASLARARGWDPAASALRDWLRLHVAEISESLHALHELNNRARLENQDIVQTCITYQLKEKPETLLYRIESGMEVLDGDLEPRHRADGFTHVVNLIGAFDEDIGGKIVLGLLLLGNHKAQFEGFECPEFDDAVVKMEKLSRGALLRLKRTELDLAAQMLAKQKDLPAREFVPDHLVEKGDGLRMNTYVFPVEKGFPDDKILSSMDAVSLRRKCTALGGLTPLEASARHDMRDQLVRHVKSLIHGIDKRRGEDGRPEPVGIRQSLRDLGLQELDFPAPPMDASLDGILLDDDDPDGEDPDSEDNEDELLKIRGLAEAGLPPVPPRLMLDRATVGGGWPGTGAHESPPSALR